MSIRNCHTNFCFTNIVEVEDFNEELRTAATAVINPCTVFCDSVFVLKSSLPLGQRDN